MRFTETGDTAFVALIVLVGLQFADCLLQKRLRQSRTDFDLLDIAVFPAFGLGTFDLSLRVFDHNVNLHFLCLLFLEVVGTEYSPTTFSTP